MIITEVYVPSLDKTYDFKLCDNIPVAVITEELSAVICQKEQCSIFGEKRDFMLFNAENKNILSMKLSLFENEIKTGDRLIFV